MGGELRIIKLKSNYELVLSSNPSWINGFRQMKSLDNELKSEHHVKALNQAYKRIREAATEMSNCNTSSLNSMGLALTSLSIQNQYFSLHYSAIMHDFNALNIPFFEIFEFR